MKWLAAALLLLFGLLDTAGAATLKIATLAPDGTDLMQALRAGAKEIKQRTSGRVKLRYYPGGVMGNDKSVMRKIRAGQLHGAALSSGGLTTIYPNMQIYSLPLVFRSFAEVDYVRERLDPELIVGLKQQGFISYGLIDAGFAYVMSNKEVRLLSDLAGQRVWAPESDELSRTALDALGISPILLPLTDVLTGLQTGLIDTITSPPIGTIALQWHTRVKYMTDLPLLYSYGGLIIKQKALKKIKPEDQAIIAEVMERVARQIDKQNRQDNNAATEALRKQGIEFISLDEEQKQDWWSRVNSVTNAMRNDGRLKLSLYDKLQQHLSEYRKTQPAQ